MDIMSAVTVKLLDDNELYGRIKSNARNTVQTRFDLRVQTKKLVDIYESSISEKNREAD